MQETTKTISVLIEREGEWWVAQCLQHDLATQARSLDDLHYEIQRLLVAHIMGCEEAGIEPFQVQPAPREVWDRYEVAKSKVAPVTPPAHQPERPLRHLPPATEMRLAG